MKKPIHHTYKSQHMHEDGSVTIFTSNGKCVTLSPEHTATIKEAIRQALRDGTPVHEITIQFPEHMLKDVN
jgi:coproporphyrinogen III oxidase-like Fe-S oxidoreductase